MAMLDEEKIKNDLEATQPLKEKEFSLEQTQEKLNFTQLLDAIQVEYSDDKKYSKLAEYLSVDKVDNYRQSRKKFQEILDVFCFTSDIFKSGNDFSFYKCHLQYISKLFDEFTSPVFKKMRKGAFCDIDADYVLKYVDDFLTFAAEYIDTDDSRQEYQSSKAKLYYRVNYAMLTQKKLWDSLINTYKDILWGINFIEPCYCSQNIKHLCSINGKKCDGKWDATTRKCKLSNCNSQDNHYKDFALEPGMCMHTDKNQYSTTMLSNQEKITWLNYAYIELQKWKYKAKAVLQHMENLKWEQVMDNALNTTPDYDNLTEYQNCLMTYSQILNRVYEAEEYIEIQRNINEIENSSNFINKNHLKNLYKQRYDIVKQKEKMFVQEFLKKNQAEISEHDVQKFYEDVSRAQEIIDSYENSDIYNYKQSPDDANTLLRDAIEEIEY